MAKTKVTGGYIADSAITSDHLHTTLNLSSKTLTIGATTVSGHLIPSANITYDLGSSTYRFRDIYLDGTTIDLGGTELKKNSDGDIEFKSGSNFKRLVVSELEFDDGTNRKKFKISSGRIKSFDSSGASDTADKISLASNTTDDLGEGSSNLYFTTARARGAISASTGIAITDGAISAAAVPNSSLTNSSVTINSNSLSLGGTLTLDTDDIGEGSTNLYFTNARARGAISVSGNALSYNSSTGVLTANYEESPTFTGTVQATSFSDGTISGITFIDEDSFATNSATRVPTQQSIKAYVDAQVAGVVDTAPAALNTLNELAAALGDDANFSTTTSTALGNRLRVDTASQGLTGTQQANAITNLGITATKAELNYVDGVTSNIQTQLNTKITSSDNITGTSAGLSGTPNISVGTISSGAITSTGILTLDTSPASNGVGDLVVIPSLNSSSGVGFAGQVFGVNVKNAVHSTHNTPQVSSTWGGVTGATAIAIQADDNSYGQFQVWTAPQDSSADDLLVPRFWITGAGNATFSSTVSIPHTLNHVGDTDTYIKFDDNRVRIVNGGTTYLDTNNGSAVLHTSTTFGGDVSGTYNAIVVADDSHNHVISNVDGLQTALDAKLPLSGGTMTGGLAITTTGNAITINGSAPQILFNDTDHDNFYIHVNSNRFYVLVDRDESGNYETPHPLELNASNNIGYAFGHRLFTEDYHPNADKWTTARTLSLTGDVTGSVSWDGSGNASITTAVANDSHTHNKIVEDAVIDFGASKLQWMDQNGTGGTGLDGAAPRNPTNGWYHNIITNHGNNNGYYSQLSLGINTDDFYFSKVIAGTASTFQRVFMDNYHPNADTLTTARTIGGVSFNGSANINLPGVNTAGNQNTSGTAAGLSGTPNITVGTISSGSITSSGYAVFGRTSIDPDSYTNKSGGFGHIQDTGWGAHGLFVHGGGTGDAAAIAHNGGNLYFGIQNGSSANSMSTWMQVSPAKAVDMTGSASVALPNITAGTISSGAITTSGALTLSIDGTDALNFSANSTNDARGISFNNRSALTADYNDGWLRLNQLSEFSNGVYTPSNFRSDGAVRGASYTVVGTTVIDSSRNLTNIGTISSSAITASGNITLYKTGSDSLLDVVGNSSYDPVLNLRSDQGAITTEGFQIWYDNSVGDVHLHTTYPNDVAAIRFHTRTGTSKATNNERFTIEGGGDINVVSGALKFGGTTVIDSARRIYPANIQNSGVISFLNGSNGSTGSGAQGIKVGSLYAGTSYSNSAPSGMVNALNGFQVNNTTVIDSSRNLTNIGTISSGAITLSNDSSDMGFGTAKAGSSVGHTASVDEGIFWHTSNDYGIYRTAGAWTASNYQQLKLRWATGIEIDGNGTTYGKSGINFLNGNIKMDGTQILDSSRNLTNINAGAFGQAVSAMDTTNLDIESAGNVSIRGGSALYFGVTSNSYNSWKTRIYSADTSTMQINAQALNFNNIGYGSSTFFLSNSSGFDIRTGGLLINQSTVISSDRELTLSNYAQGTLQSGAINLGNTGLNYAWSGTTWASDVRVGMLLNCSETYEIAVHDSGDSVDSFMKYNGTDFEMGNDIGWGTTTFTFASNVISQGTFTSNSSSRSSLGSGSGGNQGIDIKYGSGNSDYGVMRFYSNYVNNSTIHVFSTAWQGGSFGNSSAGAINIEGANGVTFGSWNSVDAYIQRTTGKFFTRGQITTNHTGFAPTPDAFAYLSASELQFGGNNNGKQGDSAQISAGQHQANSLNFVGMGTASSNRRMDFWVEGNAYFRGSVIATGNVTAYGSASDKRLKKDIVKIDNAIDKIKSVSGYEFAWNENAPEDKQDKREFGVIAQEVEEAGLDKLVFEYERPVSGTDEDNKDLPDEKWKAVHYDKFVPILIEGMKEQQELIEKLTARIEELENK